MSAAAEDHLGFLANKLRAEELALFCGAGISMAPPSRLPSWRELADGIVVALADDVPEMELARLLDAALRPDVVMEVLLEVLERQALGALRVLGREIPNANHRMIAHLARNCGLSSVLTANFDRLIEIACEEAGVPVRVVVTHEDFAAASEHKDNVFTLYKLHGTIEQPDTLVANINSLVRGLDAVPRRLATATVTTEDRCSRDRNLRGRMVATRGMDHQQWRLRYAYEFVVSCPQYLLGASCGCAVDTRDPSP